MTVIKAGAYCKASYQGYQGRAVSWRNSEGLTPERGYIDLSLDDVKQITIVGKAVPWRGVNGWNMNSGSSILAWARSVSKQTVTEPVAIPHPDDGGLNQFGDLVLETFNSPDAQHSAGELVDRETYIDVHVDTTGLEELTQNLAEVFDHDKGTIRVPLVDIRRWYATHGPLLCSINATLKRSTNPDFRTWVAHPNGEPARPWEAYEAIQFLFSQLPGSPRVDNLPRIDSNDITKLQDVDWKGNPVDIGFLAMEIAPAIVGEGEPAAQHLEKLLERYGLLALRQPNGNYRVAFKCSPNILQGQVFTTPNKDAKTAQAAAGIVDGENAAYEVKTVYTGDRPPAVMVVGKRRVRRLTLPYIPVLQDTDGRWYRLSDLMKKWGYDIAKLNRGIMVGHEKRLRDVPPEPDTGSGTARLHMSRREIASRAYMTYAPAILFAGKPPLSGGTNSQGALLESSAADPDEDSVPYLPMGAFPIYVSELATLHTKAPKDKSQGDLEDFVLLPPQVRAHRIKQQNFNDMDALKKYMRALFNDRSLLLGELQDSLAAARQRLQAKFAYLNKADVTIPAMGDLRDNTPDGFHWLETAALFLTNQRKQRSTVFKGPDLQLVELDQELKLALQEAGESVTNIKAVELQDTNAQLRELAVEVENIKKATQDIQKLGVLFGQLNQKFNDYVATHQRHQGIKMWTSIPHTLLEEGSYHLDSETGILTSSEPLAIMDTACTEDKDSINVAADGMVLVTFGYPLKTNTPADWTSVIVAPSDDDTDPDVMVAGASRSAAVAIKTTKFDQTMYLLEQGTPVNLAAVCREALKKAAQELRIPRLIEGYTTKYSGLRAYRLDGGVQTVQFQWDGGLGHTFVGINAPRSRMNPVIIRGLKADLGQVNFMDAARQRDVTP